MNTTDPRVDRFIERQTTWRSETEMLRSIALSAGLSEEMKWGKPCYSFEGKNIAITQGFKDQCAFMFFKGALLKDPDGLMEPPGPNSHAARRVMFSGAKDIAALEGDVRNFILQAVEAEKAGLTVVTKREPEPLAKELTLVFGEVPGLEEAFFGLTPGRQRAYNLHFTSAKQSATRRARIERAVPQILKGQGLRD